MSIRILIIEDNPDHILLTERALEKTNEDYQLFSTNEAREGLKKITEENYDIVLCDYRMPGFTALDMLKEMHSRNKNLPLIVVTASGNEKVAVDLMKEGAYDYIVKDVLYEDVLPVVVKRSWERFNEKKEKERLEKKIEQVAREWETTFNSITDLVSIHNKEFKIVRVNKAFADAFKTSPDEVIGKTCYEVVHCKKEPWPVCPHKQALETGQPVRAEFFESHLGIYLEVSASPIFNEEDKVVATVHIAKDITTRKEAEQELQSAYQRLQETQQQLIQSAKMAATGQLVAGVSHELNQPLTGIKGFAQALLMDLEENSPARADLKKIVEQADRMDSIIKNLRLFARKSECKTEELDINKPIQDALMLLSQQLKLHNIRLKKSLARDLPKVKGDSNQLQQVFLNLITNARDAIDSLKHPEGGEVMIETLLGEDKKNIAVIFRDTGCGIPQEDLENIFNPFFTTKSSLGGIGLGLSIAYSIIESHQGKIEVESQVGKGTTLKILLPVTASTNGASIS
jgi:PAS domain S-box-containing protein